MPLGNLSVLSSSTGMKQEAAPRSPVEADQTLSSSTASLSFYAANLSMKDRRAYERERQRTKKTAELVKTLAQKEHSQSAPPTLSGPLRSLWARTVSGRQREHAHAHGHPQDSSSCTPVADSAPKKGLPSLFTTDDDTVTVDFPRTRPLSPVLVRSEHIAPKPEVMLADLINTNRPPRKSRKGKDGDFEFVPPVRSVIALDDHEVRDLNDNLTFNEPWEHVRTSGAGDDIESGPDSEESASFKVPSYAAVLAAK